jgi:hypothetical protein
MKTKVILTAALLCVSSTLCFAKPLKVFILAGQSNMEGHAAISTFDYIGKDPLTAPMLKEMRNPDGTPRVCDKVWMSYQHVNFRKAMAAPADMPEFKGNVFAVDTAPFWDLDIVAAKPKQNEYNSIVGTSHTLNRI